MLAWDQASNNCLCFTSFNMSWYIIESLSPISFAFRQTKLGSHNLNGWMLEDREKYLEFTLCSSVLNRLF